MSATETNTESLPERSRKLPYISFYPGDFLKDPTVLVLSFEAKSIWLFMILLMHESPRRGYLVNLNGKQMSSKQLANALQISEDRVASALQEMEDAGTFSRDENSVIYCRRMAKEEHISEVRREAGAKGGSSKHRSKSTAKTKQIISTLEANQEQTYENENEDEDENENRDKDSSSRTAQTPKPDQRGAVLTFPVSGANALAPRLVAQHPDTISDREAEIFSAWVEDAYMRHPKQRNLHLVKVALTNRFARDAEAREIFDRNHKLWCQTDRWRENDGAFVPPLNEWVDDNAWMKPPPSAAPHSPSRRKREEPLR